MSTDVDIEKDPLLVLLTDALRAGPGSPQWHDAVTKLKTSTEPVDEYRLLLEAREALESGRDYRSVRAGPGFTRKLMTGIEQEKQQSDKRSRRLSTPTLIVILSALVIGTVVGLLVWQLWPRPQVGTVSNQKAIDELAGTYFANDVLSANFADAIPMGWRKIGSLPLDTNEGLRAGALDQVQPGDYVGGGIVAPDPIPPDQTFAFQIVLRVAAPGQDLTPQVFVSNSPDFSQDRAISAQELVWWLQGKTQKVVVNGNVERQSPLNERSRTVTIRIVMNRDLAIVEADGQRLWAGPHHLGTQPRYLGVRFIRTAGNNLGDLAFQSVRIAKP